MTKYYQIPEEMREYKQWIVWQLEELDEGKPTKIPYNPRTGFKASVTNPDDWCEFSEAVMATHNGQYSGIGFVLTKDDPFAFIDLDEPKNVAPDKRNSIIDTQNAVFKSFQSYAELSPSGVGAHIIVKGAVPSGRRRSSIEVYSDARYMTMTGNRLNGHGESIKDYNDMLQILWREMGNKESNENTTFDGAQIEDDQTIINRALAASNGSYVMDLATGNWMAHHPSQSEADQSLINIIAFYTDNRQQVKRIFRASALGARDKANRDDYVGRMVNKGFDRKLPPIDTDGLYNDMEAHLAKMKGEAFIKPESKAEELHNTHKLVWPPGLLGEIAKFIYDQAPRPVPEIALAGSIALMAGICGQAYNISGAGLNQYVIMLAGTGRGKDAMRSGINKIMSRVGTIIEQAKEHMGPAEIASPQGLVRLFKHKSCFLSIIGEIGHLFSTMTGPKASGNSVSLRRAFLDLYGLSGHGNSWNGAAYAQSEKSMDAVKSPAFSMLGESNPVTFYEHIDEAAISDGLLPRFTIFEYSGDSIKRTEPAIVEPSDMLIQKIASLVATVSAISGSKQVVNVAMHNDAMQASEDLDNRCTMNINGEQFGVVSELYSRVHLRTLKLAALLAVGINPNVPTIDLDAFRWAERIITGNATKIIARFERGDVGSSDSEAKQIIEIMRATKHYFKAGFEGVEKYRVTRAMYEARIIPFCYYASKLHTLKAFKDHRFGATKGIKQALQACCDSEILVNANRSIANQVITQKADAYMVKDLSALK